MRLHASEKQEQQAILELLRLVKARVYVLGTVRPKGDYPGTRQTPGLPDLEAWLPHGNGCHLLKIEVKAVGGRLSDAQRPGG